VIDQGIWSAIRAVLAQIGSVGAVSIFKDLVVTVAAILTATAAIIGLRTWQRQLRGTTKYKVAVRALEAIHALHDAVTDARRSLADTAAIRRHMAAGETGFMKTRGHDPYRAAEQFMEPVWVAQADLIRVQREARIHLGKEAKSHVVDVLKAMGPFFLAYLLHWNKDLPPSQAVLEQPTDRPHPLYATEGEDPYAVEIAAAVSSAEEFFRKYL